MKEGSILHGGLLENIKFKQKDSWFANIKSICKNTSNFDSLNINMGKKYLNINIAKQHWWKNKIFDGNGYENGNKLRSYRTYKDRFRKKNI